MIGMAVGSGRKPHGKARDAFTLIEILAVMLIILLLLGIVVGGFGIAQQRAREARARADLQAISEALARYKIDYRLSYLSESSANTYPYPSVVGTDATALQDTALMDFLDSNVSFVDPWGSNYVYEYNNSSTPETYLLWSHGRDPGNPATRIDSGG